MLVIYIIVMIFVFAFLARTSISFNPFSITFGSWRTALGWFLILIGVLLISRQSYINGIKESVKVIIENVESNESIIKK